MLYTRKGDNGTTRTFGCDQRLSKSGSVAEALGALDELNSYLGLCRASLHERGIGMVSTDRQKISAESMIRDLQEDLFIVQAETAGSEKKISTTKVKEIECSIDMIEKELPPIRAFSVAGGSYFSAHLDVARTLARKAERRVVAVHEEGLQPVCTNTLAYLNRLSSLLFALARHVNYVDGVSEEAPTYR